MGGRLKQARAPDRYLFRRTELMPPTITSDPPAATALERPHTQPVDGPIAPAAAPPPRPSRRRARLVLRVVLIALIAALVAFEVNIDTGPDVATAPALVVAIDRAHGSFPVMTAPGERVAMALVASEDAGFYSNDGIDIPAMARGFLGFLTGHDTGGSTIEIQLAHMLYPSATAGFWGRVHRVSLALQFDAHYTKAAVLSMYLDAAYFGHGYYGIGAAATGYFGVGPGQLTWGQAAMLAGLVQAPTALDPHVHLAAAERRMGYVLQRLEGGGTLTSAQVTAILRTPLGLLAVARSSVPPSAGAR